MRIIIVFSLILVNFHLFANDSTATKAWKAYIKDGPIGNNLPDFSYAGLDNSVLKGNNYQVDVTDEMFGAKPNDGKDDRDAIQKAIDHVGSKGGGVVFFPKGRYVIRGGTAGDVIQLNQSNVILRGVEGDERGRHKSILFMQKPSSNGKSGQPGTIDNDYRQNALITIIGKKDQETLARFTQNAMRGNTVIHVDNTEELTEGQIVRINLTDPKIDLENPAHTKVDLVQNLLLPRVIKDGESYNYSKEYNKNIYHITRIKRVIDKTTIELLHPLRFDHFLRYKPHLVSFENSVRGVGVEDLAFECDWPGQFVHHKPYPYWKKGDEIIRKTKEQDYGWVGIWVSWAADCWIKGVDFRDFTQGFIFTNCSYFTTEECRFFGTVGHAGVTLSMAFNLLVRDVHFYARFVHPLSLRVWSAGNVFTKSICHYDGRDQVTGGAPLIDFHGVFSYENLFDNLTGFYCSSGGLKEVHPNAGVRNVFWNISTPPAIDRFPDSNEEFFNASLVPRQDMYKEYPASFVIGIYAPNDMKIKIAGEATDRITEWFHIELLNKKITRIPSLYEAQVKHRKK